MLGSRALPTKRTALGQELPTWREGLLADLGGAEAVSTQQIALVEKAVAQKLICDSLDAYHAMKRKHEVSSDLLADRALPSPRFAAPSPGS